MLAKHHFSTSMPSIKHILKNSLERANFHQWTRRRLVFWLYTLHLFREWKNYYRSGTIRYHIKLLVIIRRKMEGEGYFFEIIFLWNEVENFVFRNKVLQTWEWWRRNLFTSLLNSIRMIWSCKISVQAKNGRKD